MTNKESIIKGLESLHERLLDAAKQDVIATLDASMVADALALLKKQEAKPVVVTTNAYGTKFYHCPKCNRDLYDYPRQRYCSQCGQAVKWNDSF